jgi:hypothetical protein
VLPVARGDHDGPPCDVAFDDPPTLDEIRALYQVVYGD